MADKYRSEIVISLALLGLTLLAFGRVCSCEFVNYDDDIYVTANPQVLAGLTGDSVRWAWTNRTGFWHPLTWMSLQLDHAVYGLNPIGFHRTNLWLHAANGLLVFWVLRWLTGSVWRSAAVAALFALHPLHVESVAWVAERKGLLSTFFGLAALGAYSAYAHRPGPMRYLLVLAAFICSLLAKPMMVTLPGILLLLDYWPLRRFEGSSTSGGEERGGEGERGRGGERSDWPGSLVFTGRLRFRLRGTALPPSTLWLFLEKLPFLIIAGVMAWMTIQTEKRIGALAEPNEGDFLIRLSGSLVAYVKYLGQTFWPSGLTVFYPRQLDGYSATKIIGALILLISLTALAIRVGRRRPYALVGWLWFVGAMLPVIGLCPLGWHERADRYTYVPHIGLFLALVWGGYDLATRKWRPRIEHGLNTEKNQRSIRVSSVARISHLGPLPFALAVFGLILMGCLVTTWKQIDYWKNDVALWQYNLAVQPGSWVGHNNLGASLESAGNLAEAESHFLAAVRLLPGYWSAHHNLGNTFKAQSRLAEAEEQYRQAVRIDPGQEATYQELGALLWYEGKRTEAIEWFAKVLQINPDAPNAHNMLGLDLLIQRKPAEAEQHFRHALCLLPEEAELHANLGAALFNQGMLAEAVEQLSSAVQRKPDYAAGHYKLAMALQRQGKFDEAARHYAEANRLDPKLTSAHGNVNAFNQVPVR